MNDLFKENFEISGNRKISKCKRADSRRRWRKSRASAATAILSVQTDIATDTARRIKNFEKLISTVPSTFLYDLPDVVDEGSKRCNAYMQKKLVQACL